MAVLNYPDVLSYNSLKKQLESNLNEHCIGTLIPKVKTQLIKQCQVFEQTTIRIPMENSRLFGFQDGNFDDFNLNTICPGNSAAMKLRRGAYKGSNILKLEIDVYNNDVYSHTIQEMYMSGPKNAQMVFDVEHASDLPFNYIDFDDYTDFNTFTLNAFDLKNKKRFDDTEAKAIFNFNNQHIETGDHFVFRFESKLDACESCQGYITYLEEHLKTLNKTMEKHFKSNINVKSTGHIKKE